MMPVIPTCQGYSLTSVSTPPTILVCLCATPQLHVPLVGAAVVVAGAGVDGRVGPADVAPSVVVSSVVPSVVPPVVGPTSPEVDKMHLNKYINTMTMTQS